MKVLLLSREYPPHVYGGAGVHAEYLSRELARRMKVEVRCFEDQDEMRPDLRILGFKPGRGAAATPSQLDTVFGAARALTSTRGESMRTSSIATRGTHTLPGSWLN